jgi:hypothetical protein
LVVYENTTALSTDAATPVVTKIIDGVLYFKAAKNHEANTLPLGEYNLYYGIDYIKYIHATPVTENNLTTYQYIEYPNSTITSMEASPGYSIYYSATPSNVNIYSTEVNKFSTGYYKLAYFNDGLDWVDNLSKKDKAKAVAIFSGPNIKIYGSVGPSYGKVKIRIVANNPAENEKELIALDWYEIDCYSTEESEKVIFQKTDLDYLDYSLEIETLGEKNILSTSTQVKINKISFLKNFNFELNDQVIYPNLSFKSIGGVR